MVWRWPRGIGSESSTDSLIRPANEAILRSIAVRSGGTFNPAPDKIFERPGQTANRPTPLWPYLLTAALLLFVLDVALRRIDFSLHWPFSK